MNEPTVAVPDQAGLSVTVSGGGMVAPRALSLNVPIGFAIADLTPHITHDGVLARLQPEAIFNIDVQNLGPHRSTGVVRLHLDVPTEAVVARLSERRICSNDGAHIYSVSKPPKHGWVCDECGGAVVQRDDDQPEAIEKRLTAYETLTRPIIDFYRRSGRYVADVNGLGEADEVFAQIGRAHV